MMEMMGGDMDYFMPTYDEVNAFLEG